MSCETTAGLRCSPPAATVASVRSTSPICFSASSATSNTTTISICGESNNMSHGSGGGGCGNGGEEMTNHYPRYKTSMCFFHKKGRCMNGETCRFAHGLSELKKHQSKFLKTLVTKSVDGKALPPPPPPCIPLPPSSPPPPPPEKASKHSSSVPSTRPHRSQSFSDKKHSSKNIDYKKTTINITNPPVTTANTNTSNGNDNLITLVPSQTTFNNSSDASGLPLLSQQAVPPFLLPLFSQASPFPRSSSSYEGVCGPAPSVSQLLAGYPLAACCFNSSDIAPAAPVSPALPLMIQAQTNGQLSNLCSQLILLQQQILQSGKDQVGEQASGEKQEGKKSDTAEGFLALPQALEHFLEPTTGRTALVSPSSDILLSPLGGCYTEHEDGSMGGHLATPPSGLLDCAVDDMTYSQAMSGIGGDCDEGISEETGSTGLTMRRWVSDDDGYHTGDEWYSVTAREEREEEEASARLRQGREAEVWREDSEGAAGLVRPPSPNGGSTVRERILSLISGRVEETAPFKTGYYPCIPMLYREPAALKAMEFNYHAAITCLAQASSTEDMQMLVCASPSPWSDDFQ